MNSYEPRSKISPILERCRDMRRGVISSRRFRRHAAPAAARRFLLVAPGPARLPRERTIYRQLIFASATAMSDRASRFGHMLMLLRFVAGCRR